MSEIGDTGLNNFSGVIREEWLTKLRGRRGMRLLREMRDNDAVVGAIASAFDWLIRQVPWRTDEASNQQDDLRRADLIRSALNDMDRPFTDFISEVMSMLDFGWSWHEIVFKIRAGHTNDPKTNSQFNDGLIGIRKLPIRAQDSLWKWIYEDRELFAMQQHTVMGHNATIPLMKSLHFRTTSSKDNPEGRSIYRNAFRSWFIKKNIEEFEAIGLERELAGFPVIRVPAELMREDAPPEHKALFESYKRMARQIKTAEQMGAVLPSSRDEHGQLRYEIVLLTTQGRRSVDTDKVIKRYEQRMAMTALADFIFLGHDQTGSFALSSDKTNLFSVALSTFLGIIQATLQNKLVPMLLQLNGEPTENPPQIRHGDIEVPDPEVIATFVDRLAGVGALTLPDERFENWLRNLIKAPALPETTAAPGGRR